MAAPASLPASYGGLFRQIYKPCAAQFVFILSAPAGEASVGGKVRGSA